MSRRLWRCCNEACPVPHGAVLGQVTAEGGLVLDTAVQIIAVYVDTRRVTVRCPQCSARREFRGSAVFSPR